MDENSQRDKRGSDPGQSTIQPEKTGNRHFIRNGQQIFTFSPKTLISWGMLSGIIGLCVTSISFYQRLGSEIHTGIANDRELNKKLDRYDWEIQDNIKPKLAEHDNRITDIEKLVNRGKK